MPDSTLSSADRKLFEALLVRGVRFMVVGMSAALLQGARGATEDIDIRFEDIDDPALRAAVLAAGGIWISGSLGLEPPRIGGNHRGVGKATPLEKAASLPWALRAGLGLWRQMYWIHFRKLSGSA